MYSQELVRIWSTNFSVSQLRPLPGAQARQPARGSQGLGDGPKPLPAGPPEERETG
jgi:hypothetical protein